MKPKSKKEILDTCQNNFFNYSTLSKIMIIISIVLSAAVLMLFVCGYIIPTAQDIIYGNIVGWNIVWRICLGFILYYVWKFANMISISIGGSAMCTEEKWEHLDFAKAWVNIYKYDKYLKDEENSDK